MRAQTKRLLDELEGMEWFANVGNAIADPDVPRVTSWKQAVALCTARIHKNVANESKNILTEKLCFEHPERYHGKWNELAKEIRTKWLPVSKAKTKKAMKDNKLPRGFLDSVQWDILGACMELEYADIVPPHFFAERSKWYLAGHFPCGWEGSFPEGKLIVF